MLASMDILLKHKISKTEVSQMERAGYSVSIKMVSQYFLVFWEINYPLNLYYSYGMWNSFGLAFDPITEILWDTQIGLPFGDEINRVDPGFNSGYNKIDGIWMDGYNIDQTEKHIASSLSK